MHLAGKLTKVNNLNVDTGYGIWYNDHIKGGMVLLTSGDYHEYPECYSRY
jgi:hypothetical protein